MSVLRHLLGQLYCHLLVWVFSVVGYFGGGGFRSFVVCVAFLEICHSLKTGKVVVILAGRHAGKKAIVVKTNDEGGQGREFGHCLVAGIERYPLPVTKSMSQKKILKRSKVKPFVKLVNYQHLMPTRYTVDIPVKNVVNIANLKSTATKAAPKINANEKDDAKVGKKVNPYEKREQMKKELKQMFEQRYIYFSLFPSPQFFEYLLSSVQCNNNVLIFSLPNVCFQIHGCPEATRQRRQLVLQEAPLLNSLFNLCSSLLTG